MRLARPTFVLILLLTTAWAIAGHTNKPMPVDLSHCETATFASGCFWGLQEELRQIPGVLKTTAGYTGGTTANPTYEQVAGGKTGHIEAVEVMFDPAKLSYETLLADFISARKKSGNTARHVTVFYHDAAQQLAAERAQSNLQITAASAFYPAEEYHQDYYRKSATERVCVLR